jgi:peptide/nickel transport system ATP-binding protein
MSGTPHTAATSVSVEGLSVELAGAPVPVVQDISFSIPGGTVMGLVGESGSGKSTVGLALLGYARPGLRITGGSVRVGDTDVLAQSESQLRRVRGRLVSYVPQDPASGLNPAHRVGPQLREALAVHEHDLPAGFDIDARVAQLLDDVRLAGARDVLRAYPHQLSGGQQQRVGIAMAFACRPRLVVLDEPTTGLDVTTQRHILETVRSLTQDYGVTAVYVSHDLPVVGMISDSTAVMYAGRLVEHGPTRALFSHPRHPYTFGLRNAAPSPERAEVLVGIEGHPPRPGRWPKGCAFADRCPHGQDACREAVPPLRALDGGRTARCLYPLDDAERPKAGLAAVPTTQPEPMVRVERLVAVYGPAPVLHDVGFTVEAGGCTAIVGESGSGKTTLARCLVGLHSQWQGSVEFEGGQLAPSFAQRSDDQRRRIQYIFQNPYSSLNPTLTVAENIEEPLRHFGRDLGRAERRERSVGMLKTVALSPDFADRMPGRLSGGERQRVAIARALVVNPDLLICDEITSALDVSVQALLVEQLRELQHARGLTMVFITHNLAVVRSIAQTVVVLEHGVVVESGPVARVLDDPQHPYTRQLLADLPRAADDAAGRQLTGRSVVEQSS